MKARCDAMVLRPNKAETVVFGCQRSGHKIVWSDYVMQNVGVSFSYRCGITVSLENNLSFEREKRVFHECFITESKGAWVDSRCKVTNLFAWCSQFQKPGKTGNELLHAVRCGIFWVDTTSWRKGKSFSPILDFIY